MTSLFTEIMLPYNSVIPKMIKNFHKFLIYGLMFLYVYFDEALLVLCVFVIVLLCDVIL